MSNIFLVGGVEFEAVRFNFPIKHWRLKSVDTGEVFEDGVVSGESRPKMKDELEYVFSKLCRGDVEEFKRNFGI